MGMLFEEHLRNYNQAYLKMDELYHGYAVKCGLSDCSFWILYILCEAGEGCSQKDLCKMLSVSKQTIHSAIRKLEQDGIVFLKAGNGKDKYIYLTETGKKFVEEKIGAIMKVENETFQRMGEEEARELQRLTWHYANLLEEVMANELKDEEGEES